MKKNCAKTCGHCTTGGGGGGGDGGEGGSGGAGKFYIVSYPDDLAESA